MSRNYKFQNPEGLYFINFAKDFCNEKGLVTLSRLSGYVLGLKIIETEIKDCKNLKNK